MSNVVSLYPCGNVVEGLRRIADQLESGELQHNRVTLVAGNEIFQVGTVNNSQAAKDAVFDLNVGLALLMQSAIGGSEA